MHRFLRSIPPIRRSVVVLAAGALLAAAGCNLNYIGMPTPEGAASGLPLVTIAAPLPDAIYNPGVEVILQARISNAGPGITRVEATIDGAPLLSLSDPNPTGAYAFSVQGAWTAAEAGAHTITITAFRDDETSSDPASVTFRVAGEAAASPSPAVTLTGTLSVPILPTPSAVPPTLAPTFTTAPGTAAPTLPAGTGPTATLIQTANIRSGPGLAFNPPIGSLTAGTTVDILARSPASDWFKVRYLNGDGWVFAALVTVSGDVSVLPFDPGPPPPAATNVPPTLPLPPTNTPQTTANLVAGLVVLDPSQPQCAQTFNVGLDVANLGSQPTSASGTVRLVNTRAADGSIQEETTGGFPILQPGETFRVNMPLTVSTFYNETHRLTLTIDPTNEVPEAQDGDNTQTLDYVLQKGTCP
ncbi:MAG TPA: SH3 domain-containing protein [Candidatus Limnocylindrales bacterium]|nr:SH3 domain-containing protein [Candidatus Limnocylindrales bacterium]